MKHRLLVFPMIILLLLCMFAPAQAECTWHVTSCIAADQTTCINCGATNVPCHIAHNYQGYVYDANEHWFVCQNCGETGENEAHTALCHTPDVCDICGATGLSGIELAHPDVVIKNDEQECWIECQRCGEEACRGSHYTFCTDQGKCSYCGYAGSGFAVYHSYDTMFDLDQHWDVCYSCGEIANVGFHTAPCTAPGHCQACGATGNITLTHTEATDEAVAPTCTEDGLTEGTHCEFCGETLIPQEPVSKRFHNWQLTSTVSATCTEAGSYRYDCNRCGYFYRERFAALGHDYNAYLSQQDGTHMIICCLCSDQDAVENCLLESGLCPLCGYMPSEAAVSENIPCVEYENGENEGISLEVAEQTQSDALQTLPEAARNAVYVFTVTLKQDDLEMAPQSNLIIRLPISDESILDGLKLMLVQEDDTLLEIAYEIQDGMIVFKTEKTGTFVFLP